ncbi:MAG: glycosyltransferase family 2 protein [Nibricoccus sp.]
MHPLAIIVPAYKARFLGETLASIASQTDRSFHCYVFDDASPEPLAAVVGNFSGRLPITYHRFEDNVGGRDLVAQWERCLARTTEPWAWLVPDDDVLEPGCAALALNAIAAAGDDVTLLRFSITTIDPAGATLQMRTENPAHETARTLMKDCLLGRRPFTLGENIFRRSAHAAVQGYVPFGGGSGSDLSLLLKLAHYGRVVNLTGARFRFRHHAAAISSGASKYQQLAIAGVQECCLWIHDWNRQARVASRLSVFYWSLRWYHACLKHWTHALSAGERDAIASFARRQWHLPRFVHNKLLSGRTQRI